MGLAQPFASGVHSIILYGGREGGEGWGRILDGEEMLVGAKRRNGDVMLVAICHWYQMPPIMSHES